MTAQGDPAQVGGAGLRRGQPGDAGFAPQGPLRWRPWPRLCQSCHGRCLRRGAGGQRPAASGCTDINPVQIRHLLSYTSQQASGITSWQTDVDHIEKTFDFAGMPARSGVTSATMVEAGFTGVWDVFEGFNNLFDSYPSIMTGRLCSTNWAAVTR